MNKVTVTVSSIVSLHQVLSSQNIQGDKLGRWNHSTSQQEIRLQLYTFCPFSSFIGESKKIGILFLKPKSKLFLLFDIYHLISVFFSCELYSVSFLSKNQSSHLKTFLVNALD